MCTGQRGRERLPGPSPSVLCGIWISSSRLEGCGKVGRRGGMERDRGCEGEMSRKEKRDYKTIAINFMPLFARD